MSLLKVLKLWITVVILWINALTNCGQIEADNLFRLTAYCGCEECCGEWSDGRFANNDKCHTGACACNWLNFGTKVYIDGKIYIVKDRGAKKYFGSRQHPIKAIDIYYENHKEAKRYGVKWKEVVIL